MAAYWNDDNFQWTTTDIENVFYSLHLTLSLNCKQIILIHGLLLHNLTIFIYMLFGSVILFKVLLFSIYDYNLFFACNNFIRNFFFLFFICAKSGGKWVGVLCFVYKIILNQLNCLLILMHGKRYQVFLLVLFFFSFVTEMHFSSSLTIKKNCMVFSIIHKIR